MSAFAYPSPLNPDLVESEIGLLLWRYEVSRKDCGITKLTLFRARLCAELFIGILCEEQHRDYNPFTLPRECLPLNDEREERFDNLWHTTLAKYEL